MFFYIVGVRLFLIGTATVILPYLTLSVSFMKTLQTTEVRPPTLKHRVVLLEVVQERECECIEGDVC